MKAATTILMILCLGLATAFFIRHNKAVNTQRQQDAIILKLSTDLTNKSTKLDEQEAFARFLETNLTSTAVELAVFSNNFVKTSADLARSQSEGRAAAEAAQAEMLKRDKRIAELEGQKNELDKKAVDLTGSIDSLQKLIMSTEKKLAASEGDREFLLKELKRMQVEKAELERQFNDLATMRTQVAKLKEELSIARRLEWIRLGLFGGQKGAERLMAAGKPEATESNYSLKAEIRQDGSAVVVPTTATNAAPVRPK